MLEFLMWKLIDNNGNVKSVAAIVQFVQWDLSSLTINTSASTRCAVVDR